MRGRRLVSIAGACTRTATLALTAATVEAVTRSDTGHQARRAWQPEDWHRTQGSELKLVQGVPSLSVDIYVVKNCWKVKKLINVNFGTAADLNTVFSGFVTPGLLLGGHRSAGSNALEGIADHQGVVPARREQVERRVCHADSAGSPVRRQWACSRRTHRSQGGSPE